MSEELNPKLEELKKKRRLHLKSKEENNDDAHEMFAQQHSDKGQFIFEILQNAEDSEASYVRFDVRNDDLEIRHDGKKVFQYEDVYSITTMGHSTKKNGVNQIGKFGVGFKAVFNITDCPIVHSGKYHFKIEKYIVPETVDPIDIGKETVFIFPFKSGNAKKSVIENCEKIKTKSENLLFLKNIKEVTFFYNGEERKLKIEKSSKEIPEPHRNRLKVTEATAKDEEGSWSFLIIESNEEIPETSHKVQIAFQKEKNKFVEIEMPVFVFFPTSKQSGLSFLVQAPYKTTPSRENIPLVTKRIRKLQKK
ncbi:sacsin N-terminal ATP-binding-like domain-containing protein [Candidatus Mycalebacterium sp.]